MSDKQSAADGESYEVYIVQCSDGTLYTGIARSAETRTAVHNSGAGARYTRSRLPVRLVYRETQPDRAAALRREAALKKLRRADKLQLIQRYAEQRPET